jgi:hypothetical protein
MYNPTHYYVRVSRAETFIGAGPCFTSPDEGPALRLPRPPLGRPETWTRPRGKGDASGALGDCRPSAGGKGSPAPSPAEDLPPCHALLHAVQGRPWPRAPPAQPPVCFAHR